MQTVANLLRAPWNFEQDYNGQSGATPILFTAPYTPNPPAWGTPDVYTAIDDEARQNPPPAGISPLLARMMPVANGSTLLLTLPIVQGRGGVSVYVGPPFAYVWRVVFRMRTLGDYKRKKTARVPYSLPFTHVGTPDTRVGHPPNRTVPVAGARVVRQASSEAAIYNRSQPLSTESAPYFGQMFTDAVAIPVGAGNVTGSPIYPGSYLDATPNTIRSVDYEQGERDPVNYGGAVAGHYNSGPFHLPKFVKCAGNEMAVECYKYGLSSDGGYVTEPLDWSFLDHHGAIDSAAVDFEFSLLLGVGATALASTPPRDTGVRVMAGVFEV